MLALMCLTRTLAHKRRPTPRGRFFCAYKFVKKLIKGINFKKTFAKIVEFYCIFLYNIGHKYLKVSNYWKMLLFQAIYT